MRQGHLDGWPWTVGSQLPQSICLGCGWPGLPRHTSVIRGHGLERAQPNIWQHCGQCHRNTRSLLGGMLRMICCGTVW